ncbi:MAG: hypothetical protein HYX89_06970, partial [Chloroflexi bacterium]|nr:hypothetical protein [Chloroflexota bacterium]
ITGGAAGVIIGLLFLLFELREASPRAAARIAVAGGEAELPIAAIAERLQREMLKVPDVRQASAQVSPRGQRVDVTLVLYTSAATSVPATASEAVRLAREALETSLGLQVGHLGVRIEPTTQPEEAPPPSSGSEASAD